MYKNSVFIIVVITIQRNTSASSSIWHRNAKHVCSTAEESGSFFSNGMSTIAEGPWMRSENT